MLGVTRLSSLRSGLLVIFLLLRGWFRVANRTYLSSFDGKNGETAHVDDSTLNTSAGILFVVWDRSTHTVHPGHVFGSVADAQSHARKLLSQPNFNNKLSIVTVPA